MPLLEFKSFEKLPKKKPFRFLSGVFRRGGSEERELEITEDMLYGTEAWARAEDTRAGTPAGHLDIEEEMETLHLSRRDNPYLSSCEALDDVCGDGGQEGSSLSPGAGSLGSPPRPSRQASLSPPDSGLDPVSPPTYRDIMALHSHLVRSPPPVHWPTKMEGDVMDWKQTDSRALSPESGVGSDNDTSVTGDRHVTGYVTHASNDTCHVPRNRSQSVERMISDTLSPVRGQTPAVSPARYTPDTSLTCGLNSGQTPVTQGHQQPLGHEHRTYSRSISQSSTRLRSKTPDEEFSPTRFNIYALHQRSGLSRSCKSKSSYLVTSPGRDCVYSYQPASRRSLAQLAGSGSSKGATGRKSSIDTFASWLPRRKRTRSQTRPDAKSMENLQSPTQSYGSIRGYRDKVSYTHKSMSCMGEDAGLMSTEQESLVTASPATHRKSLHNIKKSFSLRQKKSFTGPLYVDIDSQGNV